MKVFAVMTIIFISVTIFSKTLIGVAEDWPPFEYRRSIGNNMVEIGSDLMVLKVVLKRMGYDLKVRWMPWARCLKEIERKKADLIFSASKTKERTEFLYFPEEPISYTTNVLFYLKERNIKYEKPEDLKGLRVAYIPSYYYGEYFKKLPVVFVEVYSLENAFRMLLKGRVDLVVEDINVGLYRAKQMGIVNKISYLRKAIIYRDPSYVAFAKKPGYDKLAKEFSEELKKFKKTKEYFKIIKNYGLIKLGDITLEK